MGHIAHLRKQFISINTYDYIITLIKRRKKPLLSKWELIGSSFEETWIPIIQGCLCQDWLKFAQWFLRRGFFNLSMYVYLPSEKGGALHLNKLESPSPMDALYQVWLNLALWFWRRRRRRRRKLSKSTSTNEKRIWKSRIIADITNNQKFIPEICANSTYFLCDITHVASLQRAG